MNDATQRLTKPPIIEAVLDIDCDLPPGQELAAIETAARNVFRSQYPKLRKQFLRTFQFTSADVATPEPTGPARRIQAFQFMTADEKQLVQVRAQGFSFNRLSPYSSLDEYITEIKRCWSVYRGIAFPLQIRAVRLRYINRLLLPISDSKCKLDEYLSSAPQLPAKERLALTGIVTQLAAVETETGHEVNIVLTAQKPQENQLPMILDICAAAPGPAEPSDSAWLLDKIGAIRVLCNRIFKESVTETCLNLYR